MKHILFLSFLCVTYFSIGQQQENKSPNSTTQEPLQKQQVSKINKIEKRVDRTRQKETPSPITKEESIKKD